MASSGSNDEADQNGSTRQKSELLSMASSGSNDEADQNGSSRHKPEQHSMEGSSSKATADQNGSSRHKPEQLSMEGSSSKATADQVGSSHEFTETPGYVCQDCGYLIHMGLLLCERGYNVTFGRPYDNITDIRAEMFCARCGLTLGWKFINVRVNRELFKRGQIALFRKFLRFVLSPGRGAPRSRL